MLGFVNWVTEDDEIVINEDNVPIYFYLDYIFHFTTNPPTAVFYDEMVYNYDIGVSINVSQPTTNTIYCENLPVGLEFNQTGNTTANINGELEAGQYQFTIVATDGTSVIRQNVALNVLESPVDEPIASNDFILLIDED